MPNLTQMRDARFQLTGKTLASGQGDGPIQEATATRTTSTDANSRNSPAQEPPPEDGPVALPREKPPVQPHDQTDVILGRLYSRNNRYFHIPINPLTGREDPTIVKGLETLARDFDGTDLGLGALRPDESWLKSIRQGGSFADDPNMRGLIVLDANGSPVTAFRKKVIVTWDELFARGEFAKMQEENAWPPSKPTGMQIRWGAPTQTANLPPDWRAAQEKFRLGDGSPAIIDPRAWGVGEDADVFANVAQAAADGQPGYKPTLPNAIQRALATGRPQFVELTLPVEPSYSSARGKVLGFYSMVVRGVVTIRDGRYLILGQGAVEDTGAFNYDVDNLEHRSLGGNALLIGAHVVPDPTSQFTVPIGMPGTEFWIAGNRSAAVRVWGTLPR